MLAVSIVDKHHRETQSLGVIELHQAEDTGGGFLAASDHIGNEVCIFSVHEVYKIAAVIDDDMRSHLQHSADMGFVFLRSGIIPCEYIETCMNEGRSYVILGRERVASCYIHLGSACCENLAEVGCLGFKMDGKCDLLSLEREGLTEFFFQSVEERHVMPYPFNLKSAFLPKVYVSYFACHFKRSF